MLTISIHMQWLLATLLVADDRVSNPIGVSRMLMLVLAIVIVGLSVAYGARGARKRR